MSFAWVNGEAYKDRMMKKMLATFALLASTVAVPAVAAPLLFQFSGDVNYSFSLDSNPTPSSFSDAKGFFTLSNVPGVFTPNGVAADVRFFLNGAAAQNGGIELDAPGGNFFFAGTVLASPANQKFPGQLFLGTLDAPVFKLGDFTLLDQDGIKQGLTISEISVAAVPEPATWAMMLLGFGMIGYGARRRSNVKTTVRFA